MKKIVQSFLLASFIFVCTSLPAQESQPRGNQALDNLRAGNERFVKMKTTHPNLSKERRNLLKTGQNPSAIIVSCSDSRVPPEIVFDQGLGDLFVVRSAGNTVDNLGMGSIEYAVAVLESPLIVVMGHEYCGAVSAAISGKALPGHIADVAKSIGAPLEGSACKMKDKLDCAVLGNVESVIHKIENSQPILAPLVKSGKLKVVGAYYDFETGQVLFDN